MRVYLHRWRSTRTAFPARTVVMLYHLHSRLHMFSANSTLRENEWLQQHPHQHVRFSVSDAREAHRNEITTVFKEVLTGMTTSYAGVDETIAREHKSHPNLAFGTDRSIGSHPYRVVGTFDLRCINEHCHSRTPRRFAILGDRPREAQQEK